MNNEDAMREIATVAKKYAEAIKDEMNLTEEGRLVKQVKLWTNARATGWYFEG